MKWHSVVLADYLVQNIGLCFHVWVAVTPYHAMQHNSDTKYSSTSAVSEADFGLDFLFLRGDAYRALPTSGTG